MGRDVLLNGTTVLGSVSVGRAGRVTAVDSTVTGNVECFEERSECILERTTVENLIAKNGGSGSSNAATIRQDARCIDCILFEVLAGTSVGNDVVSRRQLDGLSVIDSTIGGSVFFQFSPTATFISGNTIDGNLEISHNSGDTGLSILSNQVGRNIRLVQNSVTVIFLQDNSAARKIRCVATSPIPTASGNTASSIDAACGQT